MIDSPDLPRVLGRCYFGTQTDSPAEVAAFKKGFDVGIKNWRLYVVILMALLAFNTFSTLFSPAGGNPSCGTLVRPYDNYSGEPTWFSSDPECPNTNDNEWIEVYAGVILLAILGSALILENEVAKARLRSLPSPPNATSANPASISGHFCEGCGAAVPVGAKFCPVCGSAQ